MRIEPSGAQHDRTAALEASEVTQIGMTT
jgi:hypothetical protein